MDTFLDFFRANKKKTALYTIISLLCIGVFVSVFSWGPPVTVFPDHTLIRIEEGTSIRKAGELLYEKKFIRSPAWFSFFAGLYGKEGGIKAGDYYFESNLSISDIALRLSKGEYGLTPIRITIPEGLNVFQIADLFKDKFVFFDPQDFVNRAPEGYLFPDTYFFLPNANASDVITKLSNAFLEKTANLKEEAEQQGMLFEDIIIMASILEEEARGEYQKRMVADILWKRIKINMPLQVDAAFSYVNGKNSYTLTREDLFDESPYNTYRNKGLPPTPIANPGIEAILAAMYPTPNEYFYFLTDLSGEMYFAETFEGHQYNRENYLRR